MYTILLCFTLMEPPLHQVGRRDFPNKRKRSNYSYLTRVPHPKCWFSKGNPLISGKSRLVKYYFIWPDTKDLTFFAGKLAAPTGQPQAVVGSKSAVHEWHRLPVFRVEIGHLQNGATLRIHKDPPKEGWFEPV